MGAAASSCTNGNGCFGINESDQVKLSRGIDKGLRETRRTLSNTSKVLLLGSGDSGKSTIIKQMRIINNVPFTEYEREIYRVQLFYNLVGGMRALLDALRDLPPLEEGDTIDANGVVIKANPNSTASGSGAGADKKVEETNDAEGTSTPLPKFTNMDLQIAQSSSDDEDEDSRTSSPAPRPSKNTADQQRPKSTALNNPTTTLTTSTSPPTRSDATTEAHPKPNDQNLSTSDANNNINKDNNNDTNDPNRPPSRTPTRSPSISLNLFNPGSLTPRQLTLLNEFMYAPDLRPGQPFPLEFESMLREAWWGLTDEEWEQQQHHHQQQLQRNHSQRGSQYVPNSPMGETHRARGRNTYHQQEDARTSQYMSRERRGAGSMLDRIERESGIALPDNLGYLYANPERLANFFEEDYMPSDDDILRCRCRTTGIQETVFSLGKALMGPNVRRKGSLGNITFKGGGGQSSSNPTRSDPSSSDIPRSEPNRGDSPDPVPLKISVGKTKLHMVDVGGQRSERRKWIHCFQDVTAVLFLVGLSGYNQGLVEDPTANQMQDAMALWDGVCSSPWLKNTSLILFLNKTDIFTQKVGKFPISDYFPDYEGEKGDAKAGMEYFRKRFTRVAHKSIKAARQSQARSRKDSRAVTTDSSTVVGSTNSRSKSKHRDESNSKFGFRGNNSNNKDDSGHIATNTTSSHGVSTVAALSFDSPRRPIGLSSSTSRIPSGSGSGSGVNVGVGRDAVKRGKEKEPPRERTVYTHFTNATDTNQLRVVIVAVCDIILRDNFAQANLI